MKKTYLEITFLFLVVAGVLIFISSCKKESVVDGTNSVCGRVVVSDYHIATGIRGPVQPSGKEEVYLLNVDGQSIYDAAMITGFNGMFEFKNLRSGIYKIFAYSNDTTGACNGMVCRSSPKIPHFIEIEIKAGTRQVTAPDLVIYHTID